MGERGRKIFARECGRLSLMLYWLFSENFSGAFKFSALVLGEWNFGLLSAEGKAWYGLFAQPFILRCGVHCVGEIETASIFRRSSPVGRYCRRPGAGCLVVRRLVCQPRRRRLFRPALRGRLAQQAAMVSPD